jgi:hypothetical protein
MAKIYITGADEATRLTLVQVIAQCLMQKSLLPSVTTVDSNRLNTHEMETVLAQLVIEHHKPHIIECEYVKQVAAKPKARSYITFAALGYLLVANIILTTTIVALILFK